MRQQINLYNPALRMKREWLTGKFLLSAVGILIVLLGLYSGVLRWQNQQLSAEADSVGAELARRQEELARLNDVIAQRRVSAETQAALQRAEATLAARERIRDALGNVSLGSSEGFSEFLRAFARQTQDGLWLVGLRMAEGGHNITLEGRALDPDLIPGYIRGLSNEPKLRGRAFEALNLELVAKTDKQGAASTAQTAEFGQAEAAKTLHFHEFLLAATVTGPGADKAANQGEGR